MAKFLAAWFVMLLISVANGALRDLVYGPHLSALAAHQVSTLIGLVLLGFFMQAYIRRYPPASIGQAWRIGLGWTALTVAFEFLFFHYVGRHPWAELLANYDVLHGRVWVLVLLWVAVAPALFYRHGRRSSDRTLFGSL